MADITFDSGAVRAGGVALRSAGQSLTTDADLVMGRCGSATVAAAADTWALWAKTTLMTAGQQVDHSGLTAIQASNAFDEQEQELAAAAAK